MSQPHFTPEELTAYLDGELELDDSRRAHLRDCVDCARRHRESLDLRRLARASSVPVPTEEMWSEITARIGKEPAPEASRQLRWRARVSAGLAGALAAACLAFLLARPETQPSVPARPETKPAPAGQLASVPPATPPDAGKKKITRARKTSTPQADSEVLLASAPSRANKAAPAREDRARAAGSADVAPEIAAPSARAAPAAPAALAAAEMTQQARAVYSGTRIVLTADRIERPNRRRIVASGHVVVRAKSPGQSFVATVDGLTRTLTGSTEAGSAEVVNPGDRLILYSDQPAKH